MTPPAPQPPVHRAARLAMLLLASVLGAGCVLNTSSPGVFLSTNPPGARVFVDGEDTGFATPCSLSLDKSVPHEVAFVLDGYAVARRDLVPHVKWEVVPWKDGDIGLGIWRFPLFLTLRGIFFPIGYDDDLAPGRMYVPLEVETLE